MTVEANKETLGFQTEVKLASVSLANQMRSSFVITFAFVAIITSVASSAGSGN